MLSRGKIFLFYFVYGFVTGDLVKAASATVSEFREGVGVSYKVVESEFSQRSVLELCPECLSGDKTASEIRRLSIVACEQMINSEECQGVNPKYLRDCEKEEESNLAFGQRVLGCVKGAALEGAIGLGVGAVLGKVIVGIGTLLSLPVVGAALGITAGGGAALYVFSEYDRAYQEVGEGEGRAMRAMGHLLGEVGTGAYRLLLGNYECYSSEGRAWEVCGLLLGGALGGSAALTTAGAKKAGKKVAKEATEKATEKFSPLFQGLTPDQDKLLRRMINQKDYVSHKDIADLRATGISMDDIGKAFRLPKVKTSIKNYADDHLQEMATVRRMLGQAEDLSARQAQGVGDLVKAAWGWEQVLMGVRRTGLSLNDAMSLRRSATFMRDFTDSVDLMKYIKKRARVEKSLRHEFTEEQSSHLSSIQFYTSTQKNLQVNTDMLSSHIARLVKSGLSHRQLKQVVDQDLLTNDRTLKVKLKELIDLDGFVP